MRCFFTFAIAAALAAGTGATVWSQTGGAGGAGGGAGASGASASGGAGTSAAGTGNTGATGTANTAAGGTGNVGTSGANGNVGTTGTAGNVGTAGNAGAAGTTGRAGTTGVGTPGRVGTGTGVNARNGNAGVGNSAIRNGANNNVNNNSNFDGISQTPFFSDAGARRQLNLNNTQYNSLNAAYQNAYSRYNQAAAGINNNANLNPAQREAQLQQLQAQFNQSLSGSVNSTVTDPRTQSRFNQLNRQFMGVNTFNDPAVRQQLNLTADQSRQLRSLANNWRQQMQQFRQRAGNDLGSVNQAQWAQMQQQLSTQLNGVLTPQQQQSWAQMTGQPYSFSPNAYFSNQDQCAAANGTQPTSNAAAPNGTQPATNVDDTNSNLQNGNPPVAVPFGTAPNTNQPAGQGAGTSNGAAPATASQGGTQGAVR